jgi:hypothetical protein
VKKKKSILWDISNKVVTDEDFLKRWKEDIEMKEKEEKKK